MILVKQRFSETFFLLNCHCRSRISMPNENIVKRIGMKFTKLCLERQTDSLSC